MGVIVVIIIAVVIIAALASSIGKKDKTEMLKKQYDTALRGSDKATALRAGRDYYGALRSPKPLTIYDEQAITNDLSTMK